ncbi:VanZ family protein, partial [Paraliobacillus quinghaiensis]
FIKRISKVSVFITSMIAILFSLEFIQVISRRGSFDIDDFILNILGALIGFCIWRTRIVQKILN